MSQSWYTMSGIGIRLSRIRRPSVSPEIDIEGDLLLVILLEVFPVIC